MFGNSKIWRIKTFKTKIIDEDFDAKVNEFLNTLTGKVNIQAGRFIRLRFCIW